MHMSNNSFSFFCFCFFCFCFVSCNTFLVRQMPIGLKGHNTPDDFFDWGLLLLLSVLGRMKGIMKRNPIKTQTKSNGTVASGSLLPLFSLLFVQNNFSFVRCWPEKGNFANIMPAALPTSVLNNSLLVGQVPQYFRRSTRHQG